jgi:F-type H+-transporting ATPase subunit delta
MTDLATLARPYAEAVFKIAKQSNAAEQWSDMLTFLSAVASDADIVATTNNPKVSKVTLQQLLLDISQDQLNQEGINFLKLLVENGRVTLLPEIAGLYEQSRAEDESYVDVDVKTAYAFTQAEEKKLVTTLEKKLNKSVHMSVQTDQSLIAGFWAKAGDTVIDGSLKGQIQQLAKIL